MRIDLHAHSSVSDGTDSPAELVEILVCDNTQRRFQYRLLLPIFKHHRGTIDVIDLGDQTCLVVYSTEADPRAMALVIGGGTAGALRELKRQMERQMEDDTPEGTN